MDTAACDSLDWTFWTPCFVTIRCPPKRVNSMLRKQEELPHLSLAELLDQVDAGIRRKDWQLSKVEFDWMMLRIREHFSKP
jgi:hypothetical protein